MNIRNTVSGALITGTEGDDTINNRANNVTINALGGNDYVENARITDVIINLGEGDDSIDNWNISQATINGGDGDDTINLLSENENITIDSGAGNDFIDNRAADKSIINTGAGNDTIRNYGDNVNINGGAGDDSIRNAYAPSATIEMGAGNDTIQNESDNVLIKYTSGDGNDIIKGFTSNSTLSVSGGVAIPVRSGNNLIVTVGDGKITLDGAAKLSTVNIVSPPLNTVNSASNTTIIGTYSNDTIQNSGNNVNILAQIGNDSISNDGSNVSITGGTGNDIISLSSSAANNVIVHQKGDGNDTIQGFNETSTLDMGTDFYTSIKSGNDLIITVGKEKITLSGAANLSKVNIIGVLDEHLNTVNSANNISIAGSNNSDTISNSGQNVTIQANGGVDSIKNTGSQVSINGGADNDTIQNSGANVTISGAAGNDTIQNSGANVTISGAAGNDTISNSGDNLLIKYSSGDGSDLITGFNANSTLSIGGGVQATTTKSDNDIVITVGDEKITLANAATLSSPNIVVPVSITNEVANTLITGTEGDDTIRNYGYGENTTILTDGGNDSIDNQADNSIVDGGAGNDVIENLFRKNVTLNGGAGNDYIENYGDNVTLAGGAGNDTIILSAGSTDNFIEYTAGDGNDIVKGFRENSTLQISGSHSTTKSGNDIIVTVDDGKITLQNAASLSKVNIDSLLNTVNSASNTIITGSSYDDNISNSGQNVTINALEGKDTISLASNASNNVIVYKSGDGNDLIQGFNETSTLDMGTDFYTSVKSGNDLVITVGEGKITLKGAANLSKVNIDGILNEVLNTVNSANNISIAGSNLNDTITNNGQNVTIQANGGVDSIKNTGSQVSINGGADNDTIQNSGANVTISGAAGNDTIQNSGDNVLIEYNKGDGNDVIQGFNATSTLSIASAVATTAKSGNDIVITVGDEKITLAGAATLSSPNIIIPVSISSEDKKTSVIGTEGNDTITNHWQNVTISALGGKDRILNYSDNAIINAGKGDDLIDGYGNNVFFQYNPGDGNDTIHNFIANSTLSVAGGLTTTAKSGNDIIVTVDKDEIKLVGAATLSSPNIIVPFNINNTVNNSLISGTDSNDLITNSGSNVTIQALGSQDYISNSGEKVSIDGGADNDSIVSSGSDNTITAGKGNDTISLSSSASNNLIKYIPGDGNDVITGFKANSTLSIAGGDYTSEKSGNDVIITAGNGKITLTGAASLSKINIEPVNIKNTVSNTIITGTEGDDTIKNEGANVTINALGGNDSIENVNKNVMISGGAGNNTISNGGSNVSINVGDGNDSIANWDGNKVTITSGAGNDSIYNNGDSVRFDTGAGDDTVYSTGDNAIINLGAGNDSIYNSGDSVRFDTGAGDDTVYSTGDNAIINFGEGNDTIRNYGDNVSINGGAGDDSIDTRGKNVTITSGKGNDVIQNNNVHGKNVLFSYTYGDGDDIIYELRTDSTLSIAGGLYASAKRGGDVIVRIRENNTTNTNGIITLAGVANLSKINIIGSEDTPLNTITTASNTTIFGSNNDDTITNRGKNVLLLAQDGNDSLINEGENVTINGGVDDDNISNSGSNVTIQGNEGNDSFVNSGKSDIINGGAGTDFISNDGANSTITGGEDNDSIENRADSAYVSGGAGNDSISNKGATSTINGNAGNDSISNSASKVTISGGTGRDSITNTGDNVLITYNYNDGNDLITGFNSTSTLSIAGGAASSEKSGDDIILTVGREKITLSGAANLSKVNIVETALNITNTDNYQLITGTNRNDTIKNSGAQVTINTFKGNDSISLASSASENLIIYNNGDGNDVINGFNATSTLSIASGVYTSEKSGNDLIISVGDDKITLTGAGALSTVNIIGTKDEPSRIEKDEDNISIIGSNYADTISNGGDNVTILAQGGNDTIKNTGDYAIIDGGKGNDTLWNEVSGAPAGGKEVSLNGGAGADYIANDNENSTVLGGADNDTVHNWGINSTIEGGSGNDSIFNDRGDKSLIDGGAGDDSINNKATSATILGGEGNDSIYNGDYGNQLVLDGGAGNDRIKNTGSDNSISGGEGNDYIDNSDNRDNRNVTINAGTGNDTINNDSDNILFQYKIGDGNDLITGFKANSTLQISNGTYTSQKSGDDVIVTVDKGKITLAGAASLSKINITAPLSIDNSANNTIITGTEGYDTIKNSGQNVTIQALGGNDSVKNYGYIATIIGGLGNDSIENFSSKINILAQDGNDSIYNGGSNNTVNGGAGDDSINNTTNSDSTIYGGDGNDYIKNLGSKAKIVGDGGDDTIDNHVYNATLSGGAGNDKISLLPGAKENLIIYNAGDGNDTISGLDATSTLSIAGDAYTSEKSGNDIVVTVGEEKITLSGAANLSKVNIVGTKDERLNITNYTSNTVITGSSYDDTISNYGQNVTIQALGGNDTIKNFQANYVSINGGAGNDSISDKSWFSTINGGDGKDTIVRYNSGKTSSIDAGSGDDIVSLEGNDGSITVKGSTGNDTIFAGRNSSQLLYQYNLGDGFDLIQGFRADSTLDMGSAVYASQKSGDDIIINVEDGAITLKGAANLSELNIIGTEGKALNIENTVDNTLIVGTFFDDHIKNKGKNVTILGLGGNDSIEIGYKSSMTVDGGAGNDTIYNFISSNVSLYGGEGNDSIQNWGGYGSTVSGGTGNDTLWNTGNNVLVDAGKGNDSIRNGGHNVIINCGEGNDSVYNYGNNATISIGAGDDSIDNNYGDNVLIQYAKGDGNDIIEGFRENSTLSVSGGHATTTKSGNDIIVTVGDGKITLQNAATLSAVNIVETPLNINNDDSNVTIIGTDANDTIINTAEKVTVQALKGNDSLDNNAASVSIDAGAGKDYISNTGRKVTITAQDGDDSISNHAALAWISGGAGKDSIFNNGSGGIISGGADDDTIEIYRRSEGVLISGGDGNDSIRNAGNKVTLSGGAGNDTIINDYGISDSISGEDGDDLISIQGAYRNSIIGGKGSDTINLDWASNKTFIQYNIGDGSDLIEGFNATSTLRIGDGNETYSKAFSGDDVIITVGKENITLKGAANLARLNIIGAVRLIVNNTKNEVELTGGRLDDSVVNSGDNVTINVLASNDTVENSGRYVTINGGADDDYISSNKDGDFVSIDGAEGNDKISVNGGFRSYIEGGKGDDSIYVPQTNNALIQYNAGDGNDYIEGFNTTSTLQLGDGTDTFSKTVKSGNVIVTTGEGQITLAGAASVSPLYIRGVEEIAGDILYNHVLNRVIDGTAGNDTIRNSVRNATISGNGGRDYITNVGYNVSISGGEGADSIFNESGNTTVRNDGESITLEGDEGNDVIENRVAYVSINGGEGDDSISSYRSNNTIIGGTGNDTIYNNWNFLKNTINYGTAAANVVFNYTFGDGNDIIYGFNNTSTLNIAGVKFTSAQSGDDIIITMGGGNVTLKDAAKLDTVNVVHTKIENPLDVVNTKNRTLIVGTSLDDTISNSGRFVTIQAAGGKDSIFNNSSNNVIDGGAGNDSINNDYGLLTSISGGAGNDLITVTSGNKVTVNAGTGEDKIYLNRNSEVLLEYNAGDGNDYIYGFNADSTLNIAGSTYTLGTTRSGDVIVTVGADTLRADKITLDGAAKLSTLNIINGTYVNFTIEDSKVTYDTDIPKRVIKAAYQFNKNLSSLTLDNSALQNYEVSVKNSEDFAVKVNWNYGSASLSTDSMLKYQLDKGKNVLVLTSDNYDDKITFSENAKFIYEDIEAEVQKGSAISTKSDQEISFDNNSSAKVEAYEDSKINIKSGILTVNDVRINSENGAGTITVNDDGLSFEGYGVQFADLEIANESYFGKLAPMTATYNSDDEIYTLQNMACIKTLADDFTKITFDFSVSGNDKYAYYKVNDVEFLVANDENDINVVEVDDTTFKILDKEIDAENIGRITLDEQITFSGTQIDYDGVQVNYTHNKPVSYSLDDEEITISDAASVTTGDETKTFNCEAGSYVINGRSFETTADLTFTADANEIRIPLNDAATEIYFDGVQVSGISDDSEIVFDLTNDKVNIPSGANLNITSPEEVKLNLAAGNFIIDGKKVSIDDELEITADKDDLKIPLSENPVTINDANITGNGEITIDNTDAVFFAIHLPDGALVENPSNNTFELTGKDSSASFGEANKKVVLTEDGTAYIEFDKENSVGIGFNTMMFEHVEIEGVDAWTIETSGTSGIDKITGITDGATVSTSTRDIDAGDLNFEVETDGAGEFTIGGQEFTSTSNIKNVYVVSASAENEIKVVPQGEEYKGDDSEDAGKVYNFDKAGDYTVNGITFHAAENSTAQTITRGVELDLSSGSFQYDGLTLSGNGTAQINRYNASLISLTDGAIVSGSDATKYNNRQFEIEGAVELIGKKFESDEKIRCGLLNIETTWEVDIDGKTVEIPVTIKLKGFVANDKYVLIDSDNYEGVTVVDKKLSRIEGVKNSAQITGNGLANVSIITTESGEFSIHGRQYKISGDSDGVTFLTDSHGNVAEINGLQGSVEGNFENEVSVNGKTVRLTGASSIKVTSDGENITEISNVAGDLVTTDGKTYRKNVRVYELGGAEKLTTSADGTIIFSGNKFETNAGKTFTLDEEGNVSGLEKAQSTADNLLANVAETETSTSPLVEENFATITLTTTDNLDEVIGDFSEGLTVNGVFVKVTDSTNFVVKDDAQNVYIETTAHDTFTINGKTFTTSADKTIFKLDASGNVSEIVTDTFYPDKEAYQIEGDFNDEIIFNGKKFCVTGTKDTSIFLSDESLITIKLARNAVEVVENGGVDEIAISGAGEITVSGKTFTTSDNFAGTLKTNSIENFVGTISGKLGGLDLAGITINNEDNFSVTGDGEKITAIENLQNGSFTCGDLNNMTINGAKISVDNSDEITLTVTDGALKVTGLANAVTAQNSGEKVKFVTKESGEFFIGEDDFKVTGADSVTFSADENGKVNEISGLDKGASLQTAKGGSFVVNGKTLTAKDNSTFVGLANSAKLDTAEEILDKLTKDNSAVVTVNADNRNVTLLGGEAVVVENTSAKVNITASKGRDTIYTSGNNVDIDLKAGGATEIFAAQGRATVENYKASSGAAFLAENENIGEAIEEKEITYDDGRLEVNSARVTFAEDADSRIINFVDTAGETQKVGFVSDDSKLDASKEKGSLILVGGNNSTITGGKGQNQIYLDDNSESTILLNGKNTIDNFNATFDGGDKVSVSATNYDFSFDGEKVSVKSGTARATLENISSEGGAARILTVINGKERKTAIAQAGAVMSVGDDLADVYYGEKSGVDFTGFNDSMTIDLRENFNGINRVTVGGGLNTLISSSQNETLTSNGTTEYIFDKDSGRDVISNFDFDGDKINVGTNAVTNVRIDKAGGVRMEIGGSAVLTLADAQGKNFKINNFVAVADENLTYNAAANYFVATAQNATLTVGESAEIWLDGSHGKTFDGDIRTLDASTAQGKTSLAGNDLDNRIFAGQGDATLWGGNGGDDLLVGGTGKNTFYYLQGNGNDTIASAHDGDIVYLSTVTLDQISGTSITGDAVSINFKDGGLLQVNSNANVTYQLADGSKFSANHAQAAWIAK